MLNIILMCISHFIFFANDITFCAFYIYSQTIEMTLNKKIQANFFLLEFKMGQKAGRQLTTSTTLLLQELLTNLQ